MAEQKTGTSDVAYDLISILYHTLQGAQTAETYLKDAEARGDQELAGFLREVQQQDRQRAERAKQLLTRRMEPR